MLHYLGIFSPDDLPAAGDQAKLTDVHLNDRSLGDHS